MTSHEDIAEDVAEDVRNDVAADELLNLRDQYRQIVGKDPDGRWGAARLRAEVDEALENVEAETRSERDRAAFIGDRETESLDRTVRDIDIGKALAKAIANAREHAALSQTELGRRVRVNQTVISDWERSISTPTIERIFDLDAALGFQHGTLLVRAGLIQPKSLQRGAWKPGTTRPADVQGVVIEFADARTEFTLPPKFTVDQWLELVRSIIDSELERGAEVTRITVTSSEDYESAMVMPARKRDLQEVLRHVERLLEAQGVYTPPRTYGPFDPNEEPF